MPFLDDISVDLEEARGPLWSAFALLADQIERVIALNVVCMLQFMPGLAGLAGVGLPLGLRLALIAYSSLALAPVMGMIYSLSRAISQRTLLRVDNTLGALHQSLLPSLVRLMPLYSLFVLLFLLDSLAATLPSLTLINILLRLALMLLALSSIYWGPLFAARDKISRQEILIESFKLVWKRPYATLGMGLAILVVLAIGVVSVGGLLLIAPMATAMLQTQLYHHVTARKRGVSRQGDSRE